MSLLVLLVVGSRLSKGFQGHRRKHPRSFGDRTVFGEEVKAFVGTKLRVAVEFITSPSTQEARPRKQKQDQGPWSKVDTERRKEPRSTRVEKQQHGVVGARTSSASKVRVRSNENSSLC